MFKMHARDLKIDLGAFSGAQRDVAQWSAYDTKSTANIHAYSS